MPLRKWPKAYRTRIENGAISLVKRHGENAHEAAQAAARRARAKHQGAEARYWAHVALTVAKLNGSRSTAVE